MILQIVCVRDRALEAFGQPYYVVAIGAALRGFADEVNRRGSDDRPNQFNIHPEDFELFHLGEYNDADAVFTLNEKPRRLIGGKDVLK